MTEGAAVGLELPVLQPADMDVEQQPLQTQEPFVATARPHRRESAALPVAALGLATAASLAGLLIRHLRRQKKSVEVPTTKQASACATPRQEMPPDVPVDLSPFGSPVPAPQSAKKSNKQQPQASMGNTPTCSSPSGPTAAVDDDARSDRDSVRDQRTSCPLVDPAQLAKTLKQMQEMHEENRKLQAFLLEHKAAAEKLTKLEQENHELRQVTKVLEQDLHELKAARPIVNTGAELESFKSGISIVSVARSTCSNDDGLGISTASVDGGLDLSRRRTSILNQLIQSMSRTRSGAATPLTSQSPTPRGSTGGAGSSSMRRGPPPEEAAALGQAVYQLLDNFGGRMM